MAWVGFQLKCTECGKNLQCEKMELCDEREIITFDVERCDCHDDDLIRQGIDECIENH